MKLPLLSIIVPVYKVEKYIEKCVRSLMDQTLKENVEFLFIDDASPDRSIEILEKVISEYPSRKEQICIYKNETNQGITETRKKALSLAKGEFVGWCDSDDWCNPEMFEMMLNAIGNDDIVIVDYFLRYEDGRVTKYLHGKTNDTHEAMSGLCDNGLFPYQLWETVTRKTLLVKAFEEIVPTMSGEDCYANMIVLYYAKGITYIPQALYHHRIISTSLTSNILVSSEEWQVQVSNIKKVEELYKNESAISEAMLRWKVYRKKTYVSQFKSLRDFYNSFPEIDRESFKKHNNSLLRKMLIYPLYFFYPTYWLLKRKCWKRNRMEMFFY